MCVKLPYANPRIDKCLIELIKEIKSSGTYKTLASCCGHDKYSKTIVVKDRLTGVILEYFSKTPLVAKKRNRYYKKDSDGFYFIPELDDTSFIIKLYQDDLDLPKETLKLIYEEYNKHAKMHKVEIDEILDLKDGWDLPDSKGYKEETIILGLLYLSKLSLILWQKFNKKLPPPFIFPGGLGEIELEWSDKIELQISIPTDPNKLLGIYGYRGKDEEFLIDCKLFEVDERLLNWLNQLL